MPSIYQRRLANCRTLMHEFGVDTLILPPGAAMKYLTGFSEQSHERLLSLIVPDDRPLCFVTPELNAAQTIENPAGVTDIRQWSDSTGWDFIFRDLQQELDLNIGIIGVDDFMPARFLLKFQELAPTALFKSAGQIFARLRSSKEADELALMQRAAEITDRAYLAGLQACVIGASEQDVAFEIERFIARSGAELSFPAVIASGPNSAIPHHSPGQRKLKDGDVLVMDLGAAYEGYHGDITRVVSIGEASDEAKKIYEIVLNAHLSAVSSVQPGITASSVDKAARRIIEEAGYGEFFIHRTGHGIGLEVHEAPNIVHGNDTKLATSMCFSVEPGIYLPGKFGVRLENIVTVTETGVRVLNDALPDRLLTVEEALV